MKNLVNMMPEDIFAKVSNLIKLEYSEWERDDIVVELFKSDINRYSYSFISYHKRDSYRKYARYWKWDHWDNKLVQMQ